MIPLSKMGRHADAHMDAQVNQTTALTLKIYDETSDRKDDAVFV
jgi:hypothetical protein